MELQDHKIFYIDEYILERNEGNEFLSLVEHYFRPKKLTFSLLEMVLLNEKGIGETYVFANKNFDAKKFHQTYINLVKKFKDEFEGGVSAFKEWYDQDTWIIVGEGSKSSLSYNVGNYKWIGEFDPRKIKSYGEKEGLERAIIEKYFLKYGEEIGNLELRKYPHYFIIVHPIRKPGNTETSPYGNLYLHFATLEKVDIDSIKDFLKEFMVIWYKCYGGLNHKIVLKKLVDRVITKEVRKYLPNKLGKHTDEFEFLFAQYFVNEDNKKDFYQCIEELKVLFTSIASKPYSIDFEEVNKFKEVPCFTDLLKNFDANDFKNFILKRALWLYIYYVKGFSVQQTKAILMKKADSAGEPQSHLSYCYQYLHLYVPNQATETQFRNDLPTNPSLSEFELSIMADHQKF